jgi:hypothetical protein
MASTPTDPTKAQVWISGTAPNQQFEFYIPRGAKGEPGGFTTPVTLGVNDNLDNIVIPGMYRQLLNSGVPGTLLNNYPITGSYGILLVYQTNGNDVIQKFIRQSYNPSVDGRSEYTRNKSNGVWSPWRTNAVTRVDNTAGRAMYAWDEANQREQLVYGDTGVRECKTEILNGWTAGFLNITRKGSMVTLGHYVLSPSASTNPRLWSIPSGFRPAGFGGNLQFPVRMQTSGTNYLVYNAGDLGLSLIAGESTSNGAIQLSTWVTNDPWPTVLPGVAVGSIPST